MASDSKQYRRWIRKKWLTSYRLNAWRTAAYALTHRRTATQPTFVLGCQRSGTTMLADVLGLSPLVKNYSEGDPRYFEWRGAPRLAPLEVVASRLKAERHPFTLLKPLCESQRAHELCAYFPAARAVWIVRHYERCVASHVRYYRQFHDGVSYVRELLSPDVPCWKNDGLASEVREQLRSWANRELNLATAYALYWLARNSLFETLPESLPVALVHYEDLLANPLRELEAVFNALDIPFRSKYAIVIDPRTSADRSPKSSGIDADVATWCDSLYSRLQARKACKDENRRSQESVSVAGQVRETTANQR